MSRLCGTAAIVCVTLALAGPARSQDNPPMATSPDQRLVATGDGNAITVTDVQTQKQLIRMQGHRDKVTALAISPDGKLLASGSQDKTVGLWDLATGRQLRRFAVGAGVDRVSFSKDGKTLTTRETDKTLREWEIATGKELKQSREK
jgi:WD40 repeat protein